ncbi:MAG: hypothetical protein O7F12_03420 [Nitrospirae bacterium]|nr:hypothetical protein [Nitrospirota bacterium]
MDANQLLNKYKTERKKLIEEVRELNYVIQRLESDLGVKREEQGDIEGVGLSEEGESHETPPQNLVIRPDEFFGKTHSEAAKVYLERVGHAVAIEELVEVLKNGGCKVGGIDPKRTLGISLVRNTREFVPPRPGYIGLRKFYPRAKAGSTKKKQ